MEPGHRSDRTGMCLQRSFVYDEFIGFKTVEKLDANTRFLVGEDNFRKIDLEICKSYTRK